MSRIWANFWAHWNKNFDRNIRKKPLTVEVVINLNRILHTLQQTFWPEKKKKRWKRFWTQKNSWLQILIFIFRDDKDGGEGFWTTKMKFVYEFGEGRFVPCYTYEKPKPVPLGTFDAVVSSYMETNTYVLHTFSHR